MRIAIMGSGALGTYYGALLKKAGQDVFFIARGDHLRALQETGIKIKSFFGNFDVVPIQATDKPEEVGKVDLILFTVKTYDTISAASLMKPMIGNETAVLPLQNMNMTNEIGTLVGMEHMLGGLSYIYVARESPGVINQTSNFHRIIFGELNNEITTRAKMISEVLETSGATIVLTENIQKELWRKLLFISPSCAISSILRLPAGDYREVIETRDLLTNAMREIEIIARSQGVDLDKDIVDQQLKLVDSLAPGATTSMQRDVSSGHRSEFEELVGKVIRMADQAKIQVPTYRFLYAALKPIENKARSS